MEATFQLHAATKLYNKNLILILAWFTVLSFLFVGVLFLAVG